MQPTVPTRAFTASSNPRGCSDTLRSFVRLAKIGLRVCQVPNYQSLCRVRRRLFMLQDSRRPFRISFDDSHKLFHAHALRAGWGWPLVDVSKDLVIIP